jgi:hypothetical protein
VSTGQARSEVHTQQIRREEMTIDPEKPKSLEERSTGELFEDTLEGDYDDDGP